MNRKRLAAIVLVLLAVAAGGGWMAFISLADRPLSVTEPRTYEVESGDSIKSVARDLARDGVIPSARHFEWLARLRGDVHRIHTGEYPLEPGASVGDFIDRLLKGRVIRYRFTLVEGWNTLQMLQALHSHPKIEATLPVDDMEAVMPALGEPDRHPEGRFLPDTYTFTRGTRDVAILEQARAAMRETKAAIWEERQPGLPLEGPEDMLILASIIERETGLASERDTIAGVFIRRLDKGMRLQTDPTIIYGLLGTDFDGRIRYRHLRDADNPYNTYRHGGLPPTPIAMPGRDAMRAAVNPEAGDALYFVSRNDGSHHFSATLEEHNRAVAIYQLGKDPEEVGAP